MNQYLKSKKIGFIGTGNLAQAMMKGMIESNIVPADKIYASNRSIGKLQKITDTFGIHSMSSNEDLIESVDIVILAMKPQDLISAIEPISRIFQPNQIIISLAAGVRMDTLQGHLPDCRIVRLMPNTPSLIGKGVLGYLPGDEDEGLESTIEDLFKSLGLVLKMETEDQLEALTVAAASGTGFVFELMMYFQDWLIEHDFDPKMASQMIIDTFLGAAMLAKQSPESSIEELQNRVASRKGVTAAGLQSMRELELERALRISFEKAAMRNSEIAREMK